jgi:hypothetical protein
MKPFLKIYVNEFRSLRAEKENRAGKQAPPKTFHNPVSSQPADRRHVISASTQVLQDVFEMRESFHIYPKKSLRKKKRLVGRSMQKKAQPRLTVMNVSAQAANFRKAPMKGT